MSSATPPSAPTAVQQTIVLVPCCGPKLSRAARAREIYRSPLFKLSRRFAEATGHPWVILSALHGVLLPDVVIEPYDRRMPTRQQDARAWGVRVTGKLLHLAAGKHTRFLSLCGSDYTEYLGGLTGTWVRSVWRPNGHELDEPLEGLGIGHRLRRLKKMADQAIS